jgi:hypothetical protein
MGRLLQRWTRFEALPMALPEPHSLRSVVLPQVRLSRQWQPHSPLLRVERQQLLQRFLQRLQVLQRRVFPRQLQGHRFPAPMPPAKPAAVQQ